MLKTKGATLLYRYDFGDRWCHTILVEEITPGADTPVPALCLGGQRACPPEDVGGPHRYAEFAAALADPAHPQHRYWLDWIEVFDTELFELSRVNRNLGWRR